MNRRQFLIFSALLPLLYSSESKAFAQFFARGLLRYAFRTLTRRSFSRFSSSVVSRSIARTSTRIYKPSRIVKTFGKRRYKITGKNGRIAGSAQIEGEILVLRNTQNRILGYIQAEGKGLAVYDGAGKRVILFKQNKTRIIAYNKDNDYLGQLIEEMVKDEIVSYFVDRQGIKHESIPVEIENKTQTIAIDKKTTRIKNGRLEIFNENRELILYGQHQDNDIALYDINNKPVATIKRYDGVISVYDAYGELISNTRDNNTIRIRY